MIVGCPFDPRRRNQYLVLGPSFRCEAMAYSAFSNKDTVVISGGGLCVGVEGRMLTADCPEQENRDSGVRANCREALDEARVGTGSDHSRRRSRDHSASER